MNLIPSYGTRLLPKGETVMSNHQEVLAEKLVTYTLQLNGQVFIIENVPARVNEETGEQFFAPSTVERLQQIILTKEEPDHFTKVPVYSYAV
ncbi:MAG: hypothetical protein GC158_03790 [Cyanobacteria bacterium RI_101]|nr:hypothetical protein [Cyanobacteria bacterium RI_101]